MREKKAALWQTGIIMAAVLFLTACTGGGTGSSASGEGKPGQQTGWGDSATAVAVTTDPSLIQIDLREEQKSFSYISETGDKGSYGEYTVLTLEDSGYDVLGAVLAQYSRDAETKVRERAREHVEDAASPAEPESTTMEKAIYGPGEVTAVPFINYLSRINVTRADSFAVSLLFSEGSEDSGWGSKVYFRAVNLDPQTGQPYALSDLVKDTDRLPELLSDALHRRYSAEGMFRKDEVIEDAVRKLLNEDSLCWTADYLGMHFYFGSDTFSLADSYQGIFVSLPYTQYPGLFDSRLLTVPGEYIAALEYNYTYVLPGNGGTDLAVMAERVHDEGKSPQKGWTFIVHAGKNGPDSSLFGSDRTASYSPFFYDIYRQKDVSWLVHTGGKYYLYGVGDRGSGTVESAVYGLSEDGAVLLQQRKDGFYGGLPYTVFAFPHSPARAQVAQYAVLAGEGFWLVQDCRISAEDGMPVPEEASRAEAGNLAFKTRQEMSVLMIGEEGMTGEESVLPAETVLLPYRGSADEWYDMKTADGSVCRLLMSDKYRIGGHDTRDLLTPVPAAAAHQAQIVTGPRQRTVTVHGVERPLVPETGNVSGDGAVIDYGNDIWWIEEEFVGRYVMSAEDRERDEFCPFSEAAMEIRKDGTLTITVSYENGEKSVYEGTLSDKRLWRSWAEGRIQEQSSSVSQMIWFDYTQEDEADFAENGTDPARAGTFWQHIELNAEALPYPVFQEAPPFHVYFTRESKGQ